MLTIFSDIISKRLSYTLSLIFEDRQIAYRIVNDPDIFEEHEGAKLVYSDYPFEQDYCTIAPGTLLFEEDVRSHHLSRSTWEGEEALSINGITDPLASIFYVVTCYEEYLSEEIDEHDRFPGTSSLMYNFGWHKKLMVERWAVELVKYIEFFNRVKLSKSPLPFRIIPTFDIDNAYAYKYKGGTRKWLSISRDLLKFDRERLQERRKVLKEGARDPFDTYDYIDELIDRGYPVKMFWLLGDYGNYDRNVHHEEVEHQKLINTFASKCEVGLHPSYQSNTSRSILRKEKERIESIIDAPVEMSRQHYLKLSLPSTYENLIKVGFLNDYTMGFAEITGFRAGIARPFLWYNLKKDCVTELSVHPFTFMDGTLLEYMHLSIEEAKAEVDELKKEVKQFGGDLVMIWHNETIGSYRKWKGWRSVLEHVLKT